MLIIYLIYKYYIYNSVAGNRLDMRLQLFRVPALNIPNGVTNLSYAYNSLYGMRFIENIDTSNVTSTAYMFNGCYNLLEIPNIDVTNVTNMGHMFSLCYNLINVPSLNVAK